MPMQIWARLNGDKGFYLVVEDSDTPPPRGAAGAPLDSKLAVKLEPAAAAGLLKALAVEALRAALPVTTRARAPAPAGTAACKSCEASIVWAEMEASRRPHPIDAAPTPDGRFALVTGKLHNYTAEDARLHRERYTSHFATCPHAGEWRGGRR